MTKTSKNPRGESKIPKNNDTHTLLEGPPRVINIGLSSFAVDLKKQDIEIVNLNWSPPARGNVELANLLSKLFYK
jgi:hypothetical protein